MYIEAIISGNDLFVMFSKANASTPNAALEYIGVVKGAKTGGWLIKSFRKADNGLAKPKNYGIR